MDEFNRGMEPEVKRYFRKIIRSFTAVSFWLLGTTTAGFYFGLAIVNDALRWYHLVYYVLVAGGLVLLIFYLYKTWRDKKNQEL